MRRIILISVEPWTHLRPSNLAPGVVTLVVPATLIYFTRAVDIGWGLSPPASWLVLLLGCILICLSLLLMYQTISLFAMSVRALSRLGIHPINS